MTERLKQRKDQQQAEWGREYPYGIFTPNDNATHEGLEEPPPITEHSLEWEPGVYGKGLVWNGQAVHTWPLDEPHQDATPWHMHYVEQYGLKSARYSPNISSVFYIDPDGYTKDVKSHDIQLVRQTDPRLDVAEDKDFFAKVADYQGYTNWHTWHTKLMMDNEQELYNESRQMAQRGATPEQIRDWSIRHIIGPHNQDRIKDAQEWNVIPEEERLDHNYEQLKDKSPQAADLVNQFGFGPDVSDSQPDLIDPELVNWHEIHQHLNDEINEDRHYEEEHDRLQGQGLTFAMPGHKDETNQMLDAWLKHHGVLSQDQRTESGGSAEHHTKMQVPIEHLPMDEGEYTPEQYAEWQQQGYGEPRVRSFGWSTLHDIQRGQANPWQTKTMTDALAGQGHVPEQIQHIMRQQYQLNPETERYEPLEAKPKPVDPTLDQPGGDTFPSEWTSSWHVQADKLHDFLMNPKSRPDLQTPEAQDFLSSLKPYHNDKTDALMPWLTREWKKGRIQHTLNWPTPLIYKGPLWQVNETEHRSEDGHPWMRLPPRTLNHWADFMQSNHPIRRGLGDIMQHTIPQFHEHIENWDRAMEEEAKEKSAKGGEVVHQWPDNWTIRRLHTPEELKGEGDAMGHCVGGYHDLVANGRTSIYSLRDPDGQPHVTTEIEPKYVEDEAGHRHKKENLEGPFSSREMAPHRGEITQIQGKANGEPNDEYKQRMREWFETFPEHERPKRGREEWADELADPADIEPKHLKPEEPGEKDEYGLDKAPMHVDYDGMLNNLDASWQGRGNYAHEVYELAKARGEIPELGKNWHTYREDMFNDYDQYEDGNYDWQYEQHGPDPEMIEDPHEAEQWGYANHWDAMTPEERDEAQKEYEARRDEVTTELYKHWLSETPKAQAIDEMGEYLKPHENTRTGEHTNELYDPRADPGGVQYTPPYAFSSWHI